MAEAGVDAPGKGRTLFIFVVVLHGVYRYVL